MSSPKLLIIAGTHGNEINPIWAVEHFKTLKKINNKQIRSEIILGNPKAIERGTRYIDYDLNRSFNINCSKFNKNFYEIKRARSLVKQYGIGSSRSCQIAIDLHTTTASMGMYGRREKDFCLASILQYKFGLPIYLHEKDSNQQGFLVEAWPCGLVIEIGPVAQNLYDPEIVERFQIILNFLEDLIHNIKNNQVKLPPKINVYVHQKSIDYPRYSNSSIKALIHPSRVNQDWISIKEGSPLFLSDTGETIIYTDKQNVFPVFIGEASYKEKNIAMSYTKRETLKCSQNWISNFLKF